MKRKTRDEWYSEYMEYRKVYGYKKPGNDFVRCFLNHCDNEYKTPYLTQEMLDRWTTKRQTESVLAYKSRNYPIRSFVRFINARGGKLSLYDFTSEKVQIHNEPVLFSREELKNFFKAADEMIETTKMRLPYVKFQSKLKSIVVPAMFRMLYSTGLRPNELRWLECIDVDLDEGIVYVRRQKGFGERVIALHPTLISLLKDYDELVSEMMPGRRVFFPNDHDEFRSSYFLRTTFKKLWYKYNPPQDREVVAYSMRHNYAVENIMSWKHDGYIIDERALVLMKSMGHKKIESTAYYFHLVPMFADTIQELSGESLDDIIPDL